MFHQNLRKKDNVKAALKRTGGGKVLPWVFCSLDAGVPLRAQLNLT